MNIRRFRKADLIKVLELCREVRDYHNQISDNYFKEQDDEYEQTDFLASLTDDNTIALVAENDGNIVGYLLADEKEVAYLRAPKLMHICNFGVGKTYRNQGIGHLLMDEIVKIAEDRQVDEIKLGVFINNTAACHLYEQYGFKAVEQRMSLKLRRKNDENSSNRRRSRRSQLCGSYAKIR